MERPSSLNSFYYFFIFWFKRLCFKTQYKIDNQLINNYRPVSFGKIFERIIFDNIYIYLDKHNLLNPNQSGLKQKIHLFIN